MAQMDTVRPNRRGVRSRDDVLDAAQRLMAEHGYEAATLAAIAQASRIPSSSLYHYFGSKSGVLLAVIERGAARFFEDLRLPTSRQGTSMEHLETAAAILSRSLERHPDFLRLLLVLAMQPASATDGDIAPVVGRIRSVAAAGLRAQIALAYGLDDRDPWVEDLSHIALAVVDGAFIARETGTGDLSSILQRMPAVLDAIHANDTETRNR